MLKSVVVFAGALAWTCAAQAQPAEPQPQQVSPVSISPAMPALPSGPADPVKMAEPAGGEAPKTVTVDRAKFRLGVGDQVAVRAWDDHRFDATCFVTPDGMVSLPLINEIKAEGLTLMELQDTIEKAALSQMKSPHFHVELLGVHSKHVYFDGEGIGQTGAMELVIPTHLLEGISARGGFRDFADKKHITILRGGKKFMVVNYKELISGKHADLNILLEDGDHVIVN